MPPPIDNPSPVITSAMSPYTIKMSDKLISVDASGGTVTLNLPAIGTGKGQANIGWSVEIKDLGNAGTNAITITPAGTNKIEGANRLTIDDDNGYVRLGAGKVDSGDWKKRGDSITIKPRQQIIIPLKGAALDAKTMGVKDLFTVPLSKIFILTEVVVKAGVMAGVVAVGAASVQDDKGNVLIPTTSFTGLDAATKILILNTGLSRVIVGGAGGTKIQINFSTAYTATTSNLTIDLIGYFLN